MYSGKNAIRNLRSGLLASCFAWAALSNSGIVGVGCATAKSAQQTAKTMEQNRERAYNRQLFTKNFRDLQLTGQDLLKEHESRQLTSERLAKASKTINKCAKTLRALTAFGDLAIPQKINKNIQTPLEYDESIRLLAQYIRNFAHNPVHQNSKVFNTDQAKRAQTDLLAIIDLSKAIGNKAKGYIPATTVAQ